MESPLFRTTGTAPIIESCSLTYPPRRDWLHPTVLVVATLFRDAKISITGRPRLTKPSTPHSTAQQSTPQPVRKERLIFSSCSQLSIQRSTMTRRTGSRQLRASKSRRNSASAYHSTVTCHRSRRICTCFLLTLGAKSRLTEALGSGLATVSRACSTTQRRPTNIERQLVPSSTW